MLDRLCQNRVIEKEICLEREREAYAAHQRPTYRSEAHHPVPHLTGVQYTSPNVIVQVNYDEITGYGKPRPPSIMVRALKPCLPASLSLPATSATIRSRSKIFF